MRLFVAVDPSPEVISRVRATLEMLRSKAPSAKWVNADSLHVTLAFLGERDPADIDAIALALSLVAQAHAPFTLRFCGGGTFGHPRRPRVLWAGCQGEMQPLVALHEDVARGLAPLGFVPDERAFSLHLTLARARTQGGDSQLAACRESLRDIDFGEARIDMLRLYESQLSPSGARYEVVSEATLGPPASLS